MLCTGSAVPGKSRTLSLIFIACLGLVPQALKAQETSSAASSSIDIAYGYFKQARNLLAAGRRGAAAGLLDISLEFYPDFSESCFLYSSILLREQKTTRRGLAFLRKAVASASWLETEPAAAETELARVLVRTREYAQAKKVLEGMAEGRLSPGLGSSDNPDAALLWSQCLSGLGDGAARFLEEALKRYPGDSRLYVLQARAWQQQRQAARALEVLGRGRRELPNALELSLEMARIERDRSRRLSLLLQYFQLGGKDPAAAALALTLGPETPESYLERFFLLGGNGYLAHLDELGAFLRSRAGSQLKGSAALAQSFARSLREYTGTRIVDDDQDGYYEEEYQYSRGVLERWVLDRDQDGLPEAEVRFAGGVPQSLAVPLGAGDKAREELTALQAAAFFPRVEYRYSSYPFLREAAFQDERSLRVYQALPFQVRLELFTGPVQELPPLALSLRSARWPDEREAASFFYQLKEYLNGSSGADAWLPDRLPDRLFTYFNGSVMRMDEAPDSEGRYAHVVEYSRSQPTAGRRDLDGDGLHEIREEYSQGKLSGIALDQDGDGRPEYRQLFGPGSSRASWDYNDDGITDSKEYSGPDGQLIREFSSRLNGTFDARAAFRSGRLVSFQRDGRSLTITPSSQKLLYWLGRPGPAAEPFIDLPEGLNLVGGREYYVFTHQGRRYVEEL